MIDDLTDDERLVVAGDDLYDLLRYLLSCDAVRELSVEGWQLGAWERAKAALHLDDGAGADG